jgi:hypothetical protein
VKGHKTIIDDNLDEGKILTIIGAGVFRKKAGSLK